MRTLIRGRITRTGSKTCLLKGLISTAEGLLKFTPQVADNFLTYQMGSGDKHNGVCLANVCVLPAELLVVLVNWKSLLKLASPQVTDNFTAWIVMEEEQQTYCRYLYFNISFYQLELIDSQSF